LDQCACSLGDWPGTQTSLQLKPKTENTKHTPNKSSVTGCGWMGLWIFFCLMGSVVVLPTIMLL
jgi:hypothetical protein